MHRNGTITTAVVKLSDCVTKCICLCVSLDTITDVYECQLAILTDVLIDTHTYIASSGTYGQLN